MFRLSVAGGLGYLMYGMAVTARVGSRWLVLLLFGSFDGV